MCVEFIFHCMCVDYYVFSLDEEDVKTMEVEEDYQMTQKIESVEKEQPKPDTEKG